jgi:hypothetical protein
MAAYVQLYDAIEEQLRINGRALGMEREEVWNLRLGVKFLRERLVDPHLAVQKMFSILENYADLHDKTIMPDNFGSRRAVGGEPRPQVGWTRRGPSSPP